MNHMWLIHIMTGLFIGSAIALLLGVTGAFGVLFVGFVIFPAYYNFFMTVFTISSFVVAWFVAERVSDQMHIEHHKRHHHLPRRSWRDVLK